MFRVLRLLVAALTATRIFPPSSPWVDATAIMISTFNLEFKPESPRPSPGEGNPSVLSLKLLGNL